MTASFIKLSAYDNAKFLTDYDAGTDIHTLKVVTSVSGQASAVRLSPGDNAKLATDYNTTTGIHTLVVAT